MRNGFAYAKVFVDSPRPLVLWESGARFVKEDGRGRFLVNCPMSMLLKRKMK